jgi:hypothetical protein
MLPVPVESPASPVAPHWGDPAPGFRDAFARKQLRAALEDLEDALGGRFTHYSGCGIECTCGLDGLNKYLGRTR